MMVIKWPESPDLYRRKILEYISQQPIHGIIVDLGGSKNSLYVKKLIQIKGNNLITLDADPKKTPDIVCDLEKRIPLKSNSADWVLALNIFEHIFETRKLLGEIKRILRPHGTLIASTPFLKEIHDAPNDYFRFTPSAWKKFLSISGFEEFKIESVETGPIQGSFTLLKEIFPAGVSLTLGFFVSKIEEIIVFFKPNWIDKYIHGVIIKAIK